MHDWLLKLTSDRAEDIETRLNKDPQFVPIKERLAILKEQLAEATLTGMNFKCFQLIKEVESLEDAILSAVKDQFYMQGIRDGIRLATEPKGVEFPQYYAEVTQIFVGGKKG